MTEQKNTIYEEKSKKDSISNPSDVSADVVNLSQVGANTVKAEIVRISQSGAEQVIATEVEVKQGAVNRIQAENVSIADSATAIVQAASVDVNDGVVGLIRAHELSFQDSGVGVVHGETVKIESGSSSGVIITQQVKGNAIQTKLLLASNVEGNVETVFDTNQVLFVGMVAGAVIGVILYIGQLLSRRW